MSDLHPVNGRPLVAAKVCAACGRRVPDDAVVGSKSFCHFAYKWSYIRVRRLPFWKRRAALDGVRSGKEPSMTPSDQRTTLGEDDRVLLKIARSSGPYRSAILPALDIPAARELVRQGFAFEAAIDGWFNVTDKGVTRARQIANGSTFNG